MRKLHTELEIFHQPAIRNPFLLYFLLVLRTFNETKVTSRYVSECNHCVMMKNSARRLTGGG